MSIKSIEPLETWAERLRFFGQTVRQIIAVFSRQGPNFLQHFSGSRDLPAAFKWIEIASRRAVVSTGDVDVKALMLRVVIGFRSQMPLTHEGSSVTSFAHRFGDRDFFQWQVRQISAFAKFVLRRTPAP